MSEGQYDLRDYGGMLANRARRDAFHDALAAVVTPGCTVLDAGAGTGAMALLAARLGARHVYAVEPNPAIHVARELARHNDLADRITFLQDLTTNITLPERADVMVSDLRGVLPFFGTHIPSVIDARERLLTPDAALVPGRDVVHASVVEDPKAYAEVVGPWAEDIYGLDMRPVRNYSIHGFGRIWAKADQVLAAPAPWCALDYRRIESASMDAAVDLEVNRAGTIHGGALWADTTLTEGVGQTSAPGDAENLYGQQFLPLERPVTVAVGDRVRMHIEARHIDGDYAWRWRTTIERRGEEPRHFDQSTVLGAPTDLASLKRRAHEYAGPLTPRGRLAHDVLRRLAAGESIAEIAAHVHGVAPGELPTLGAAHAFVADLAARYGA